jgi:hypothetical protein
MSRGGRHPLSQRMDPAISIIVRSSGLSRLENIPVMLGSDTQALDLRECQIACRGSSSACVALLQAI